MSSSTVHPGDIAGAGAPPAPGRRSTLRSVALPTEHGGWGLTLEPVLLGLLLRWSGAGLCLGVAAFVAFTARTPLKVVLVDARRRRVLPRTRVAQRVLAAEAMLLSLLVAAALVLEASAFWMPLVVIVPLVLVELWFDMRSRGRRLVPELVGAIGMGGVVAVIVLAGDGSGRRRQRSARSCVLDDPRSTSGHGHRCGPRSGRAAARPARHSTARPCCRPNSGCHHCLRSRRRPVDDGRGDRRRGRHCDPTRAERPPVTSGRRDRGAPDPAGVGRRCCDRNRGAVGLSRQHPTTPESRTT